MFVRTILILLVCVFATIAPARAAPISLSTDGVWSEFSVGDVGDVWRSPLDGEPIAFILSSSSALTLRIVDLGFGGDVVDVILDGNVLLGSTSSVPVDDTVFAFSPDEALPFPSIWSQGNWMLDAGVYSVTGRAAASPFGGATWAISAIAAVPPTPVPEPPALWLLLFGLVLVAATRQKPGLISLLSRR